MVTFLSTSISIGLGKPIFEFLSRIIAKLKAYMSYSHVCCSQISILSDSIGSQKKCPIEWSW